MRTIFSLKRGLLICGMLSLAFAAPAHSADVEVLVTMRQPPLAEAFVHTPTLAFSSFTQPHRLLLSAPASRSYLAQLSLEQHALVSRILAAIPNATVRWRFRVVLNGFAIVVPRAQLPTLARVQGVARVWPSVAYHLLLDRTPQLIGAPTVWGPTLATAGQGMKIGIIDDGIDQTHPFFASTGFAYPP